MRAILLSVCLLLGTITFLSAQNLKVDITNNDLEALKSKVALLEPDFKAFPYLAHYLATTKEFQQNMLDYLIAQGADVDQVDDRGVGPLYHGIVNSNLGAVQTLIASKAKVNAGWKKPKNGSFVEFPLYTQGGETYSGFSSANGNIESSDEVVLRPLWVAFQSSNVDMVPTLLAAGADPLGLLYNVKDNKTSTAKKAVFFTNTVLDQVTGTFATYTMDNNSNERLLSPTLFANGFRIWQATLKLPKTKQPVVDPKLTSNLFAYFTTGDMKAFKAELVKTGANTLAFLPYAALAENWDIVNLILQYNSLEIDDAWDNSKQSLLSWCLGNQHVNAAKLLLDHGATVPDKITYSLYRSNYGSDTYTSEPLVRAARAGNAPLVQLLLDAKVDPNAGFPLAYAQASPASRDALIKAGANISTSLFYKQEGNYSELNAGLVAIAANESNPEAVKFWLSKGLEVDQLAMAVAVYRGSSECVKLLLTAGADPGGKVEKGYGRYVNGLGNYGGSYYDSKLSHFRDMATSLANDASDPLVQNRYNNIVKQLDKALAAK